MRYDPCLYQAIYPLFDSDLYVVITLIVFQVILVYYLLQNDFDCYLVIFGILNWDFQVEFLDVYYNTGSSSRCPLRSHCLLCIENHLYVVVIGAILSE